MTKARTLADFISDGSPLADGTISVSEVSGAAPLASPTFTGNIDAGDNVKLRLGNSDDLQIYHDGSHSYVSDQGTGNLRLLAANFQVNTSGNDGTYIRAGNASDVELFYGGTGGTVKLATTSTGVDITGNATFGDNDKAIFGAGSDLQIYHSGTHSRIVDSGTGSLLLQGTNLELQNGAGTEVYLTATENAEVSLRHNNNIKLATTTSGVDITGEVKADKFTNDEALPTVRPSLLLDFANSKTLDPRITFTRGSTATYWDGHTTTKAEENLTFNGLTLTGTGWTNSNGMTVTPNAGSAPDGTTTATQLTLASGKAYYQTVSNIGAATYTASVYVKQAASGSATQFRFATNNTQSWSSGGTASVTLTSSWQRVTITGTLTGGVGNMNLHMDGSQLNGNIDSNSVGNVLIWGAQVELRSSATAFTPTTSNPIVKYQPTLQTAASGEARFDHDPVTGESKGLLIEQSRTNLYPSSTTFTDKNVGPNSFVEATVGLDGVVDSALVLTSLSAGSSYIQVNNFSVTSGTTYTVSCWVKLIAGASSLGGGPFYSPNVDFASNTVGKSEVNFDTWTRVYATAVATSTTATNITIVGYDSQPSTRVAYFGLQVEAGSFPTSYIPTSGSTVTRAVEQVTMSNIASELNGQEGTLYIEATPPDYTTGDQRLVSIGSSHSNVVEMFREYSSTNFFFAIRHAGTTISQGSTAWAADTTAKAAIGYKSGDIGFAADGSLIMTNTGTFAGMEMNQMLIGRTFQGGASAWSGEIKKIAYYPQKFTNATLQAMTEE